VKTPRPIHRKPQSRRGLARFRGTSRNLRPTSLISRTSWLREGSVSCVCLGCRAFIGSYRTTIAAGPWNGLCYRYRLNFPKPVPFKIRDTIPEEELENFLLRDFIEPAVGDRTEKLNIVVRYALSYKKLSTRFLTSPGLLT